MLFKKFIKKKYVCLVCGYDQLPGPLYNEKGIPDVSLICACCAFQPGHDDEEIVWTIETYRKNWLQEGSPWLDTKEKPKHWDLKQQLANINIKE